jgi:hypothetical protein
VCVGELRGIDARADVVPCEVVDRHVNATLDKVIDRVMVDVSEAAVVAELAEREARRLRDGGRVPSFDWKAIAFDWKPLALKDGGKPGRTAAKVPWTRTPR